MSDMRLVGDFDANTVSKLFASLCQINFLIESDLRHIELSFEKSLGMERLSFQ